MLGYDLDGTFGAVFLGLVASAMCVSSLRSCNTLHELMSAPKTDYSASRQCPAL
jgi:hypothetical protein